MSARGWLVATGITVAVLVALAALVVALRSSEVAFDPDAPEGTVQRYVAAVIDGDLALARSTFAAALAIRCPTSAFARSVSEGIRWDEPDRRDDWHVRLVDTATLSDGQVRVRVLAERIAAAPPFDVGSTAREHAFVLAVEDGAWRLTAFDWPSPCP